MNRQEKLLELKQFSEKFLENAVCKVDRTNFKAHGYYCPKFLVLHYTAGAFPGDFNHLMYSGLATVHYYLKRNGDLIEMVPPYKKAWHAGRSRWGKLSAMSNHSIGIEIENWGFLTKRNNKFYSWNNTIVDREDVEFREGRYWQCYTKEQITKVVELTEHLSVYLYDVLRHSDIAPSRKVDPGPLFPYKKIRSIVFNRSLPQTRFNVNIREMPNKESKKVDNFIPKGTTIKVLERGKKWSNVYSYHRKAEGYIITEAILN